MCNSSMCSIDFDMFNDFENIFYKEENFILFITNWVLFWLIIFWSSSIGIHAEIVGLVCFFNIDSVTISKEIEHIFKCRTDDLE